MDFLHQPWHWSIAGLIIGLTVPALLIVDNRRFGLSMTLKHLCAMCVPMNIKFLITTGSHTSGYLFLS
ncbi:MAG: hypothetical protein IPL23_10430 [Saprospiraceae bacterium]|nr:hypothetical protein [Saprospiraceae bacterium]